MRTRTLLLRIACCTIPIRASQAQTARELRAYWDSITAVTWEAPGEYPAARPVLLNRYEAAGVLRDIAPPKGYEHLHTDLIRAVLRDLDDREREASRRGLLQSSCWAVVHQPNQITESCAARLEMEPVRRPTGASIRSTLREIGRRLHEQGALPLRREARRRNQRGGRFVEPGAHSRRYP
ncbi:MAG: hypothetical protein AB7I33_13495 [Gemmatimonadales bacterium]